MTGKLETKINDAHKIYTKTTIAKGKVKKIKYHTSFTITSRGISML